MTEEPRNYHGKYFLTLVFASIFLASFGILAPNAFAMGAQPGSCNNEYDGPITLAKINNGTQTFDPLANPGATFQIPPHGNYYLLFIVHTPNQNRQGNSNLGEVWLNTSLNGFYQGGCNGGAGPDQNYTYILNRSCSSGNNCETSTVWGTTVNEFSYGTNFVTHNNTNTNSTTAPNIPTNITPISISTSQIDLMWNAPINSSVTGYKVERSTDGGLTWSTIASNTNSTTTMYFDSGLQQHSTYYYRISAINQIGTSSPSDTASTTTQAPAMASPSAPQNLQSSGGNSQVTLSWIAPSSNSGSPSTNYKVYRGTSSGTEIFLATTGNVTSYNDTSVTNGQTYFYKVTAVNSVGESSQSNEASATPSAPSGPVVATIPVSGAQGIAVNSNTNKIYVANGNGYSIQVIDGATTKIDANITTSGNPGGGCATSFVALNPNSNLIYTDNQGCTHWSYGGPGWSAQSVSVINGTNNNVIAQVAISHGSGYPDDPIAVNPITNKIYALANGAYEVVVINGSTNQVTTNIPVAGTDIVVNPQTNTIYVLGGNAIQVIDGTTDSIVKNFSWGKSSSKGIGINPNTNKIYVSNNDYSISIINGTTDQLIVNIPSDTYGFVSVNPITNKIYVSDAGGGNYVTVLDGSTNTILNTIQVGQTPYGIGINPNTNKIYVGNSGSSTVSVIDGSFSSNASTAPSAPQNLQATAGNSQISLSWSVPSSNGGSAITGYYIYRGTTSGGEGTTPIGTVSGLTLTYTDTGLTNGQTYYYKIIAVNSGVQSAPSNEASAMPASVPYPPQNLQGFSGNSQVSLSWSSPSNNNGSPIINYNVYRGFESGKESLLVKIGNVTTYNDNTTGATNGGTYFYKVTALNSVGESSPSNEISVVTPSVAAPDTPTGLTATTISSSQIDLSWSSSGSVTGFKIERSNNTGTTWATIVSNTDSTVTAYNDTGLTPSTTYTYRVSTINSVGTSSPSNTASATTSASTPPPPTGIVLNNIQSTSGTVSSSPYQITLANFNSGASTNRLLVVGVEANNNNVASVTFGGVQLTKKVSTFSNNDAEFWYLKNPSGTGNIVVTMAGSTSAVIGAYSFSGVDQTTPMPTSATNHNTSAGSPTITITTVNPNSLVLDLPSIYGGVTLGSPTCTQQWDVHIAGAITGASSSTMASTPGSVTCKWTASSGDLWDDVAVEVKAYSTGGTITVPSSPTGLTAMAAYSSQINLSWAAPTNNGGAAIIGYKIERSTDSGSTWSSLVANTGSTSTKYSDTGLNQNTAYTYRVSAINSVGASTPSNIASATTPSNTTVPSPPTGLTTTVMSSSQINLSWTAPSSNGGSAITGYDVERSVNNGNTWSTVISNTGSTNTRYNNTGLSPSTTYTYRVSAINPVGTGSPSNTSSATTTSVVATSGITIDNVQSTSSSTSPSNPIMLADFNVGTGNNRLLVVGVSANNNNVASITFGGVPLTKKVSSFHNNDAEFWYMVNPTGTGAIVVTMKGSTSAIVGAYSISGVDQSSPLPTSITNYNSAASSPVVSITTKFANDLVVDLPSIYGGVTLGSPTCTQQWNTNMPSAITGASSSAIQTTAGLATCKWTASSSDLWDDAAIEIAALK